MAYTDMDRRTLERYRSDAVEPADFDAFWTQTVAAARGARREPVLTEIPTPLTDIETIDVEFSGFGGDRVRAWYLRPRHTAGPLPVLVRFCGYGRGRSFPHEHLVPVAAGYAHFVMETRGVAGPYASGTTADPAPETAPSSGFFATRGLHDPAQYVYTRVITDAVRLVDEVRCLPGVNPAAVVLVGNSQGGGIAVAASGLSQHHAALAIAHPFLVDIPRGLSMASAGPYDEIVRHLRVNPGLAEAALRTLSYVDGVHFARRSTVPSLMATGLMDPICPPSTAFALRAAHAGPVDLRVFPFGDHDSGGPVHVVEQLEWIADLLAPGSMPVEALRHTRASGGVVPPTKEVSFR